MVRTRFAPSPTGYLHIGGVRTALYNWLYARQKKGKFILRIEDTDAERSTEESINAILDGLKWLNLDWDEGPEKIGGFGPYYQSKRLDIYNKYLNDLIKSGKAYRCFCTQEELKIKKENARKEKKQYKYDGKCRNLSITDIEKKLKDNIPYVIRLKVEPDIQITFSDPVRGDISVNTNIYDDFIIRRSDGFPIYNFAVVIDDATMKINYVIRGDDHISNTPKQILIYKALNFEIPNFAHLPMILGEDKTRLSKRHGATAVQQFKEEGYLPESLINYLVRLGWGYDDSQEIFSIEELIKKFSLEKVSKNPAVFNFKKLQWLNGVYIQKMNLKERTNAVIPFLKKSNLITDNFDENNFPFLEKIVELVGDRLKLLTDIIIYADYFFTDTVTIDEKAENKLLRKIDYSHVGEKIYTELKQIDTWKKEILEKTLESTAANLDIKRRDYYQFIRVALTGKLVSPDLLGIMLLMGKNKVLDRLMYITEYKIRSNAC